MASYEHVAQRNGMRDSFILLLYHEQGIPDINLIHNKNQAFGPAVQKPPVLGFWGLRRFQPV